MNAPERRRRQDILKRITKAWMRDAAPRNFGQLLCVICPPGRHLQYIADEELEKRLERYEATVLMGWTKG